MEIKYIDIGVNLFCRQFAGKEEQIAEEAQRCAVGFIITGSSERSSSQAAEYVKKHEGSYATAGVHPHDAKDWKQSTAQKLREMIAENAAVVAVGECGLDYDRMYSPADVQRRVFEQQVLLAEEVGKPLFLHEREATEDFAAILSEHREAASRAVVHCFTGNAAAAERYLELGCMIGITGWVCDERRNGELLKALQCIPAERLMAETDAPYLIPRGIRGLHGVNLPQNVVYVVRRLAAEKGMDEEELRKLLLENTKRFFSLGL